jgi:DNA-binding GntR family transcriptional regulator
VKARIAADPNMTELPSLAEVMGDHKVSRGVALRAFGVLRQEGVAEPAPGERWRVVRSGARVDRRPLDQRIADVIAADGLEVGEAFPSASALAERFGVSRPTVAKALEKLETAGVLAGGGQGKVRTVRALPIREERS